MFSKWQIATQSKGSQKFRLNVALFRETPLYKTHTDSSSASLLNINPRPPRPSYLRLLCRRHHFRYNAVLLRAEFDQHKNERDMMKVKKLIDDAEYQLWSNQHYQPKQCTWEKTFSERVVFLYVYLVEASVFI